MFNIYFGYFGIYFSDFHMISYSENKYDYNIMKSIFLLLHCQR